MANGIDVVRNILRYNFTGHFLLGPRNVLNVIYFAMAAYQISRNGRKCEPKAGVIHTECPDTI